MNTSEKSGEGLSDDLERLNSDYQSLRKESETRNNLLKIVAHDLLSPASSMSGLAKLLLKREDAVNFNERQLKIIQTLDRAMDQYLGVLGNIMEMSKLLRGKIQLNPSRIKLKPMIEKLVRDVSSRADEKNIIIQYACRAEDEILADEEKLEQTIRRLLDNALMFTNSGGRVALSAAADEEQAAIEVTDTGVGIEYERLANIFSVEEKNYTFGTDGEKGSGMSLCIAKRIAQLSGGDLEITSEPGRGTIARLTLPAPRR